MQVGSLAECVTDFSELSKEWQMVYPTKGEVLVVSNVAPHPNPACREKEIVLLEFEEYPDLPGICDKTMDGKDNFVEVQPPITKAFSDMISEAQEIPSVVYY